MGDSVQKGFQLGRLILPGQAPGRVTLPTWVGCGCL
jgi:hypothetical protein